ncbi:MULTISPECIES: antibiotic biosynthesis monooxygenase family protein [Enterococcus]|uniref:ABM domain-containing protein n=1 Tax=Candidatus Enterococcus mangumiae TaxID=2230878 RepID=A0ABZ2SWY1_9ENTE|nr:MULTISPECIES: putative quinol monooxygenase [unclassified Enterococcus]MBO0462469.1 antibiotic biosynthesis monooxygenase [Enterococcus sp. DIV1298c]MBO0490684.1 antibiotic biosynthesis monooxygenase [Enterococcus sp. DIV1094]MBO1299307.1 antibiotic biosynthesis monooxygenase [Enterococcus sp. DIV1271a]
MSITVNILYTGKEGSAKAFAKEMTERGIVERIRAQEGNERYEYFIPLEEDETILLVDRWADQAAIDRHHQSEMMVEIAELRKKYHLKMKVQRFIDEPSD